MNFELALEEKRLRPHQLTALHLLVGTAWCGVGAVSLLSGSFPRWAGISLISAGVILCLIVVFANRWLRQKRISSFFQYLEIVGLACMGSMMIMQRWWIPVAISAMLIFAILYTLYWNQDNKNHLLVRVNGEGISLPVISKRRFLKWQEVEQILLRFGVLTIDCHDNYLFQWNVSSAEFDKNEFEQWCSSQIDAHRDKREKEW